MRTPRGCSDSATACRPRRSTACSASGWRLPHRFDGRDRPAGYRYDLSILQAEFSLTQVLDRPLTGRVFFEEVIRENLDLGRPDQVQLIFDRRVTRRTPGRFRTRVLTDGVVPSLHVDYKKTRIKQYHKEGQALRTETTINNTRDFAIGRTLKTFPRCGRSASRPTDVCSTSNASATTLHRRGRLPDMKAHHRRRPARGGAAVRRSAGPGALARLVLFVLQGGFSNKDLREQLAPLLGKSPANSPRAG